MLKQQRQMFLSIVLLMICGFPELNAQSKSGDTAARLNKLVSERFAATRCPGLSVVVAVKNEIVFSSAQGMADVEQGVALEKDSVHRLASLSKVITGTIIMDLVAQRKLELDTSVKQYLPELPEAYQSVTLRYLLDHQSDIRGYDNALDVAFSMVHFATSRDAMKTFIGFPLVFPPGTKTEYGSLSFTVAGAAAESATGRSFQEISRDFFVRHGISGFFLDDPLAIVPKRVRGYLVDSNSKIEFNDGRIVEREYLSGTAGAVTNARAYDISNRYPAGGFAASGEDLLRFVINVGAGKVLGQEALHEMWTAQPTADGTNGAFGIGWGRVAMER
jgi:CubicO group peptidase (beta-lactamase class C family)